MKPNENAQQYWRSLDHLAQTPQIQEQIKQEFAGYEPGEMVQPSRRGFLKLAGASMALAGVGLAGCRRWPKEAIVPQVSRQPSRVPGEPEMYATAFELGGFAQPLLAKSFDGRPIKVEGNPSHPMSRTFGGKLGASTLAAQATVLEMYDPERSRRVIDHTGRGPVASDFGAFISSTLAHLTTVGDGASLAILHEATSSPSFFDALARFRKKFPKLQTFEYEPISRDNERLAAASSYGKPSRELLDLTKADVIVSFDSDFLGAHPASVRYGNDWASRRRTVDDKNKPTMNRMFIAESTYSTTGSVADVRLPTTVAGVEALVAAVANKLGMQPSSLRMPDDQIKWVDQVYTDLMANKGRAVVTGGPHLSVGVLQMINAINGAIGAYGSTVLLAEAISPERPSHLEAIKSLARGIREGGIKSLLIIGGNPMYDAPADLQFGGLFGQLPWSAHLSLHFNETSEASKWHVNRAHYLESWGDSRAWDGTITCQQPLIQPLFNGVTPIELLAALSLDDIIDTAQAQNMTPDQALVRRTMAGLLGAGTVGGKGSGGNGSGGNGAGGSGSGANASTLKDPYKFEQAFRKVLHDGLVEKSATAKPVNVSPSVPKNGLNLRQPQGIEARFRQDYTTYDGRFANNGWLQECPDPITKVTWDNVVAVSYADAMKLGIETGSYSGSLVKVTIGESTLEMPAYILPGQPDGTVLLPLGYGRTMAGTIGSGTGFDTYRLRTTGAFDVATNVTIVKSPGSYELAMTQDHHLIDNLGFEQRRVRIGDKDEPGKIVHESTLAAFLANHEAPHAAEHKLIPLQLWKGPYENPPLREGGPYAFNRPHAWGMSIDMNACIGCNACVVACQAENNVPIVGKDQVIHNREMHWIRIDRYFKGSPGDPNPEVTYQPMMCVQCENAPCEEVCPVAATVHDSEGLNVMVYNRCIGTRYCNNNCPYKVRRFNYLDWQSRASDPNTWKYPWLGLPDQQQLESIDKITQMVFNPDVTVRMRGVMEKCSFCAQRIKHGSIQARNEYLQQQQQGIKDGRTDELVKDFEVVTACQQSCPVEAIVFGDLNSKDSMVTGLQKSVRSYGVLAELGNRPRAQHMAKIRNTVEA